MRILIILIFAIVVPSLLMVSGCNPPKKVLEDNLRVTTDAVNNAEIPGANYDFSLTVESDMPPNGVKISIYVVGESDNLHYSPVPDIETSGKATPIHLSGLPLQQYAICNIKVTSKSNVANSVNLSFRVIRK